jgi:hypothetical protein
MKWRAFSPEEIPDVALNLATLLRRLGLPVDNPEPRQDILLLDNGMRGTARAALKQNTRDWIAENLGARHPGLRELAGTYCWRTIRSRMFVELADAIDAVGLSAETVRTVWTEFDELRDDTARKAFIERVADLPRES